MTREEYIAVQKRVVADAALAPSAENTQPWYFRSNGASLTLFLDRRHLLASDLNDMLALTGLGACLEYAVIAGRELGYVLDVTVTSTTPSAAEGDLIGPVAFIEFNQGGQADPLYTYLSMRCTCRRLDPKRAVENNLLLQLSAAAERFKPVKIDWFTDDQAKQEIGNLVGLGNRIRLEHQPFHAELFEQLRFSDQEARATRDGLDVSTLQLPTAVTKLLRSLRKWPRMRLANWLGFSRSVAKQAAQEVRESSAIGILTAEAATIDDLILGGRAFARLWLTATSLGLALHPTASLPVFLLYAQEAYQGRLMPKHARLAREIRERFDQLCPRLNARTVQMAFRIGYGNPPETRSLRRPVEELLDFD